VLAIITPDAGKALFEGAAVDELFQDFLNYRTKGAELGFVGVGMALDKGRLVPLDALPEGRWSRIASAVRAHAGRRGRRWVLRKRERRVTAEPTLATGKRPAARRVGAEAARWLRSSSLTNHCRYARSSRPASRSFQRKQAPSEFQDRLK